MKTKISVIIPVLNGARFIDRAMGYLNSQTFRDFETILVVDTGSTDDTVDLALTYSDCAKVIVKDAPGPLGVSRNMGVDASEGEFIWYMDVDDRPLPNLLERMVAIQEEHDADVVGCNFIYAYNVDREYDLSKYDFKVRVMSSREAMDARAREEFPVTAWSKIYRRSMLIENRIEFNDQFCEDVEYTYKTLYFSKKVCYTEEPLYLYYQHPRSITNKGSKLDERGKAELNAYKGLEEYFSNKSVDEFNRYSSITRIRSSGHMTYDTFIKYAKSKECRGMLKRYCSDPISPETLWYRVSPTTYYIAERVFFRMIYYRDGRIFTDPSGLIGFTRPKIRPRHSDAYTPNIPEVKKCIPITIGICAYNEENNIERTIRAIFTQNMKDYEIEDVLVVSSGSTDSTDSIVESLSKEFPQVRLLPQKKREGKNSAINLILDNKRTKVMVLLNADNVFEKEDSLEKLIEPLQDPKVGMVGGHPIPTNEPNTIAGFTVQLMWRVHHHVSLQYPKTGELVAFRDVGTRLPTDMQSDEDILRMKLENKGYRTVYAQDATILNHGPDTVKDYIKQRVRVNIGEFYLNKKFEYHLPTHNYRLLVKAFFSSLKGMGFHPIRTAAAVTLELYSRLKARAHTKADKGDMNVWEQVTTTKKL